MDGDTIKAAKPEVVVVNDDVSNLELLSEMLRMAGYEPRAFSGAEAALTGMCARVSKSAPAEVGWPQLIVTDLYMPGIDGWRFCRLLRSPEYAAFNSVPILVVSATFSGDDAAKATADLGANAFLPAPVHGPQFLALVQALLQKQPPRIQLQALLVEDEDLLRQLLAQRLRHNGYEVTEAASVAQARAGFAAGMFDLAILDYHLPDGEGDVLLEEFCAQRPGCLCLMMTVDPSPELAVAWMRKGAAAYIRKPFAEAYLIELCEKARRERSLLRVKELLELRSRELRESEARFRSIAENAFDLVALLDQEGRFYFCNRAFSEVLGHPAEELSGFSYFRLVHPEERDQTRQHVQDCLAGRPSAGSATLRLRHRLGHYLVVDHRLRLLPDSSEGPRILISASDMTERREMEAEKAKIEAQFMHAQKMEAVGRLAGGVAHDFNNMLQAILSNVDLAMDDAPTSGPLFECIEEIRKSAHRSADLTRQLLAFARKQTVIPRVLDLNAAIGGALKMIRRMIGEDIRLTWLPSDDLWPVKMDPSQVDQLLANLCVNARDAIVNAGEVIVETSNAVFDQAFCAAHPSCLPGEYVRLSISDDGCGMDQETMAHLFEPFFTTKGVGEGTGLGLATVYGIVKQNHGFIHVSSRPGKGTTFWICLPRERSEPATRHASRQAEPPQGAGETVLVVEDDSAILGTVQKVFHRLGYAVLVANSPDRAVQLAEAHADKIDLLVTDVVMPEMNGRDLARLLQGRLPGLKCLFMSGYPADVIARHGVLEEGVHFIHKPFTMHDMGKKLREILDGP